MDNKYVTELLVEMQDLKKKEYLLVEALENNKKLANEIKRLQPFERLYTDQEKNVEMLVVGVKKILGKK